MLKLTPATRIAIGLGSLSVTVLLLAQSLEIIPDGSRNEVITRARLCETIAINFAAMASENQTRPMVPALNTIVSRNPDMHGAVIRRTNGELIATAGDTADMGAAENTQDGSWINVPIYAEHERWGDVALSFEPLRANSTRSFFRNPTMKFVIFVALVGFLAHFLYLRRMLRYMDPSKVVPDRVKTTLDTLAEGLLVMDTDNRIVLANRAFAATVGVEREQLLGRSASDFPWASNEDQELDALPWSKAIEDGEAQKGVLLNLAAKAGEQLTFLVNTAPIEGDDGRLQGSLTSFDDITPLEKKKDELRRMFDRLKESASEIHRQNEQLEILATHDPLTSSLNRRAFFEQFDTAWTQARNEKRELAVVMVDIDHFKSINDNHGHSTGDFVLERVAATLNAIKSEDNLVCRYGGEEFCVLLSRSDLKAATDIAEQLRLNLKDLEFDELSITASLGVSSTRFGATSPQDLLDEADQCLYVAKRGGRNQVVNLGDVPDDLGVDESKISRGGSNGSGEECAAVPFQAVTALISALAYRDLSTAEHSRRVADMAVAMSDGLMSLSECYILETAALLHDIGKIGVPDAILLKPGPLTAEEWKLMHDHDRIGVEIISASFASEQLSTIVENHHAFYGVKQPGSDLPTGEDIPLGARILTIADAYDAMVSDRVYRKGRPQEEAFAELRRCAGSQFDPVLVERFIEAISDQNAHRDSSIDKISKNAALVIGTQIERLSVALDKRDLDGIKILADRLREVATSQSIAPLADHAQRLTSVIDEDVDAMNVLEEAYSLLELCRGTQSTYLPESNLRELVAAEADS